jgi:hypothetical protein
MRSLPDEMWMTTVIISSGCLMARGALARREMRRFLPGRKQFRAVGQARWPSRASTRHHGEVPCRSMPPLSIRPLCQSGFGGAWRAFPQAAQAARSCYRLCVARLTDVIGKPIHGGIGFCWLLETSVRKKRERANLRSIHSREDPHTTKETDDILSFSERRKTEEKDKKTPLS